MLDNELMVSGSKEIQEQLKKLRERATKDALTGLLNRGTTEQYINRQIEKMREKEICALFIIDLDNFKTVNDTLGHQAGDQVLKRATQILSSFFRPTDIVGRLGGDEFIVFMVGKLTENSVRAKGQTICDHIQLTLGEAQEIVVTASVGINMTSKDRASFETMYRSADMALYKAKKNGRRCFCIKINTEESDRERSVYKLVNTVKMSNILNHIDSGVLMLELSEPMKFIYLGPAIEKMLNLDTASLLKMNPLDLIDPDDRAHVYEMFWRIGREEIGSTSENDVCRVCVDGGSRWWKIHTVRVEYTAQNPVLLLTITDVSEFKQKEKSLEENNERLQTVLNQTMHGIWEVNLESRLVQIYGEEGFSGKAEAPKGEFPENLINTGWISKDSAEQFREFATDLLSGVPQSYGNFMIRNEEGGYDWAAFSYRLMYNEEARPYKAVGVIEGIDQSAGARRLGMEADRRLPEEILPSMILDALVNLSRDEVRYLWREGVKIVGEGQAGFSYSQLISQEKERFFSSDYPIKHLFLPEELIANLERGNIWNSLEYRRAERNGQISWVQCVLSLCHDNLTGEAQLLSCVCNIDQRKRWERLAIVPVEIDPVTRLYTRGFARQMAKALMKERGHINCGLAVIRSVGLSVLASERKSDIRQIRNNLFSALAFALGTSCIAAQYGTDSLLVFSPDITSEAEVKARFNDAFVFTRGILSEVIAVSQLRFIAGMVYERPERANFDRMERQAEQLGRLWQNSAVDIVAFFDKGDNWSWMDLQNPSSESQMRVHPEEMERPLTDWEKTAAMDCMSEMILAGDFGQAMQNVLKCLGGYYRADRIYLLHLEERTQAVTMPYEWTAQDRKSISQVISGMKVERFPLLIRCREEQAPVYLSKMKKPDPTLGYALEEPWHFLVYPIIGENGTEYYLCVENARYHISDSAVIGKLAPLILKERERYRIEKRAASWRQQGLQGDLPNLRTYMEEIRKFNSDAYASMGAVCIDVPQLSVLNSRMGFEYGRGILWYIRQTVEELFGKDYLFRTWDAEFAVLCPNIASRVFEGRCIRLKGMLERRHPKEVRVGYVWAAGSFDGKDLVDEAHEIMCLNDTDYRSQESMLSAGMYLYNEDQNERKIVKTGRLTVFFQPKVNLVTGRVMGGEALVRGTDSDGGLVLPEDFLPQMKEVGTIRNLDFFVLERVFSYLDMWIGQGMDPLPISINFAKETLMSDFALASFLAIQSRYPQVSPELIEIEIDADLRESEYDRIREQMAALREWGVRFSLDQFGRNDPDFTIFRNLSFHVIKLDRRLVREISKDEEIQNLVKEIAGICDGGGMSCVAVGVESMEQISNLIRSGCIRAQGFYYDRPLPAEMFRRKYLHTKEGE